MGAGEGFSEAVTVALGGYKRVASFQAEMAQEREERCKDMNYHGVCSAGMEALNEWMAGTISPHFLNGKFQIYREIEWCKILLHVPISQLQQLPIQWPILFDFCPHPLNSHSIILMQIPDTESFHS